ncbi:hypothetical protein BHM03_00046706 [Ensete ventricosum]|nr:hypothetical protein BHM03_00046706 [Ensete ventricosum]
MVPQRWIFVCVSELALDENLSHQHMGAVYHRERSPSASTNESHGGGRDHVNDQELLGAPLRLTMQLQEGLWIQGVNAMVPQRRVFRVVERGKRRRVQWGLATKKTKCLLERRWTRRSATVPQRRINQSRRKGCRCKATDSRAMGLAAPWYRRGGTSMESSIPCSHEGRAMVVKGAEEVENVEANFKYQDRAEEQRPRNFIRPVSMSFSSR